MPAAALVATDMATACGDPFHCVSAECAASPGVRPTDREIEVPRPTSLTVSASAQAEGSVAAATTVTCVVKQDGDKGGCSATLPGQASACVGEARVDLDEPYSVCVTGHVRWVGEGGTSTQYCVEY